MNVYKNLWDDLWYNEIVNKASHNYTIIETQNIIFHISSYEEQKYNQNGKISSINLLECEKILNNITNNINNIKIRFKK